MEYYQLFLQEELVRRQQRNPRYSVRAFAIALKSDAGTLSKILSGKQIPSSALALRFADAMQLPPDTRDKFARSVEKAKQLELCRSALEKAREHLKLALGSEALLEN